MVPAWEDTELFFDVDDGFAVLATINANPSVPVIFQSSFDSRETLPFDNLGGLPLRSFGLARVSDGQPIAFLRESDADLVDVDIGDTFVITGFSGFVIDVIDDEAGIVILLLSQDAP